MPIVQTHMESFKDSPYGKRETYQKADAFWRDNPMLSPFVLRGYYSEFIQEHQIMGPTPDYHLSPIDAIPYFGASKKIQLMLKLGVHGLKELWRLRNSKDPKERAKIEREIVKLMKQGIDMGHTHASTKSKARRYRSKDDDFRRRK